MYLIDVASKHKSYGINEPLLSLFSSFISLVLKSVSVADCSQKQLEVGSISSTLSLALKTWIEHVIGRRFGDVSKYTYRGLIEFRKGAVEFKVLLLCSCTNCSNYFHVI